MENRPARENQGRVRGETEVRQDHGRGDEAPDEGSRRADKRPEQNRGPDGRTKGAAARVFLQAEGAPGGRGKTGEGEAARSKLSPGRPGCRGRKNREKVRYGDRDRVAGRETVFGADA